MAFDLQEVEDDRKEVKFKRGRPFFFCGEVRAVECIERYLPGTHTQQVASLLCCYHWWALVAGTPGSFNHPGATLCHTGMRIDPRNFQRVRLLVLNFRYQKVASEEKSIKPVIAELKHLGQCGDLTSSLGMLLGTRYLGTNAKRVLATRVLCQAPYPVSSPFTSLYRSS
ncbi:hypothetical protein RUM44_002974 [Polyplax serrata]|uniref:Uncharacterized protein n=1 Tax=Polyplax serrata TaxID=468196 RepID=A0ABR1AX76_POLSC